MKNHTAVLFVFFIIISVLNSCNSSVSKNVRSSDNQGKETTIKVVYNYSEVLKTHKALLKIFQWPVKHELDLNDDGVNEEFLAVEGYSRGMDYALFHKVKSEWNVISGSDCIPSGHIGINKSDKKNKGWHDFVAMQPSGRGGIVESYFSWDGECYILVEQKEVEY